MTKTSKINKGIYEFEIRSCKFEVEKVMFDFEAYKTSSPEPIWDLFAIVDGRRVWINDYATKRAAVAAAELFVTGNKQVAFPGTQN